MIRKCGVCMCAHAHLEWVSLLKFASSVEPKWGRTLLYVSKDIAPTPLFTTYAYTYTYTSPQSQVMHFYNQNFIFILFHYAALCTGIYKSKRIIHIFTLYMCFCFTLSLLLCCFYKGPGSLTSQSNDCHMQTTSYSIIHVTLIPLTIYQKKQ